MSSSTSFVEETPAVVVFQKVIESSSEEPPMSEWSSLIFDEAKDNPKVELYRLGLYSPGSSEICAKYIAMSDSSVLRHVYYNYPGIIDPGIMDALLKPEPIKIYSYDGQELYMDLCKEMGIMPVRSFHRSLLKDEINLRYYCVNPVGVRAMSIALVNNKYVKRLDLTSNHLTIDACYHLGVLLGETFALQELVLSGCKLGPEGVHQLVDRMAKKSLDVLDLSRNAIGDAGFEYLAAKITRGFVIKRLNLSYNELSGATGELFAECIERNNTITHLDISWNQINQKGANDLLRSLGNSQVLTEMNYSWNALVVGLPLRKFLGLATLKVLDLSNNRLSTAAVSAINARLQMAKKLETLNLSYNPISPANALILLVKLKDKDVKLKNLLMDNIEVHKEFAEELKEVKSLKYRAKTIITYGTVARDYILSKTDLREIIMRRLDFLTTRATPKCTMDISLWFMAKQKTDPAIEPIVLLRALKYASAPIEEGVLMELPVAFPGPLIDKGKPTINVNSVVEYIKRLWPEKHLPPTPPPLPTPVKKSKKKGKKK